MKNQNLTGLIYKLKAKDSAIWKRIASDLEKPTRDRRIVNLSKINRFTKEDETIIVPGKVLGTGLLDHKLTIAAYSFSQSALDKITKASAKALSIEALMNEQIKGKKLRILG
jgi:large subunit ribosomal protein L18e